MSSYATYSDLDRFLEGFATHYYGNRNNPPGTVVIDTTTLDGDLDASFNRINVLLDSIGRVPIVPVGTNVKTGYYHPHLIEWNAVDTIYNKLRSRHMTEFRDGIPDWMQNFATRANEIFNDIIAGKVVLDTDTTNRGIGYPVKVGTIVGVATFHSNWDSGFYTASDYPKIFRIKISGTTEGSAIGQAYFQISEDDGYSYDATESATGTTWISIKSGLNVRWEPAATLYGTQAQLSLGDTWQIRCVPMNVESINSMSRFKTFRRG